MSKRIDRVDTRAKLPVRRDPYWMRLAQGRYVGYRRLTKDTEGTWLARHYDGERYHQQPLGDFATKADKDRFDAAKLAAEEWFKHLDQGGETQSTTVKAACESYVAKLKKERSEAAANSAEGYFRRLVYDDPIAGIELTKLKPQNAAAWRERVIDRGSRTYFNRNATALRAALNQARDDLKVSSDFAWSKALRPLKIDDGEGRRTLYLTAEQRHQLVEKASDEFRPLLTAWTLLPVRPGEIAKLRVEDLNVRERVLHIPSGKTGSRKIPLAQRALEHFKVCAKDKLPSAWLISKANGAQWDRFVWRDAMREAVKAAGLPPATVAYSLRHAGITDLVTNGLDVLTVSQISGTSIMMIQKHYGHLQQERARDALDKLAAK